MELAAINKAYFWSYDFNGNFDNLPKEIIIEKVLYYGTVEELKFIFNHFEKKEIRKIWKKTLLNDNRYDKLNFYLALFFFQVKSPKKWLQKYKNADSRAKKFGLPTA